MRLVIFGVFLFLFSSSAHAQSGVDFGNLFGAMIRSGIAAATQDQWSKLARSEVICIDQALRERRSSVNTLINQGVGPTDSRIGDIRSACRAAPEIKQSIYTVDGLNLGGRVALGSSSYAEYQCASSEQFDGLIRCVRRRAETSSRGSYTSVNSILHTADGTAVYINRYLEPAFFAANEAADDIKRLATKFGPPRTIEMSRNTEGQIGLIAYWGEVTLHQVSTETATQLAAGKSVRSGILLDHIGNFRRSAQLGLPIYSIGGGAGYVWSASWNDAGRGQLRFFAVDARALSIDTPNASVQSNSATPPTPVAAKAENEPRIPAESAAETVRARSSDILKVISDNRTSVKDPDAKRQLEEIEARIVIASNEKDPSKLKVPDEDINAAIRIVDEARQFKQLSEVAGRRVMSAEADLQSVTFDAPLIQQIKLASAATQSAISDGRVKQLMSALDRLNSVYDSSKLAALKEARAQGFETVEAYEDFKQTKARLGQSGIRLNKQ